jgi:hypothetical protein
MPLSVIKEKLSQVKGHLVTMPIGAPDCPFFCLA